MATRDVYLAKRITDLNEGKGGMKIMAAFTTYSAAALYIDYKPGVQGRTAKWSDQKYGDWEIEEFPVYETAEEVERIDQEARRQRALGKLNKEDRKALGLE